MQREMRRQARLLTQRRSRRSPAAHLQFLLESSRAFWSCNGHSLRQRTDEVPVHHSASDLRVVVQRTTDDLDAVVGNLREVAAAQIADEVYEAAATTSTVH